MHEFAEPFLWHGTNGEAVVLVHSFTGTPAQMRPLAEKLHGQGFTVHGLLLDGHGTAVEDLAGSRGRDWLSNVREAADRVSGAKRLHLVGFAMGGLLCLQLADDLEASSIVTINSPLRFATPKTYLAPVARFVRPYHYWPESEVSSDDPTAAYRIQYPGYPLKALTQFVKLTLTTRRYLKEVECPALIVQTRNDRDTHPSSAEAISKRMGTSRKEILWLEGSEHNALLGEHAEFIGQRISAFLESSRL